jgi:replication factor A1
MADSKPGQRKAVFTKVEQLRPGTSGHNLTLKVVDSKIVVQRGGVGGGRSDGGNQSRQMRIAECLVGDETSMIIFTARNEQGTSVSNNSLCASDHI